MIQGHRKCGVGDPWTLQYWGGGSPVHLILYCRAEESIVEQYRVSSNSTEYRRTEERAWVIMGKTISTSSNISTTISTSTSTTTYIGVQYQYLYQYQ